MRKLLTNAISITYSNVILTLDLCTCKWRYCRATPENRLIAGEATVLKQDISIVYLWCNSTEVQNPSSCTMLNGQLVYRSILETWTPKGPISSSWYVHMQSCVISIFIGSMCMVCLVYYILYIAESPLVSKSCCHPLVCYLSTGDGDCCFWHHRVHLAHACSVYRPIPGCGYMGC